LKIPFLLKMHKIKITVVSVLSHAPFSCSTVWS
jgi:hypothetical protein